MREDNGLYVCVCVCGVYSCVRVRVRAYCVRACVCQELKETFGIGKYQGFHTIAIIVTRLINI